MYKMHLATVVNYTSHISLSVLLQQLKTSWTSSGEWFQEEWMFRNVWCRLISNPPWDLNLGLWKKKTSFFWAKKPHFWEKQIFSILFTTSEGLELNSQWHNFTLYHRMSSFTLISFWLLCLCTTPLRVLNNLPETDEVLWIELNLTVYLSFVLLVGRGGRRW